MVLLVARVAAADENPAEPPAKLEYRPILDVSLTVGALIAYTVSNTVGKAALAPDRCRWCEPPGFDASIRDSLRWDDSGDAHVASNLAAFVATPVASVALLAAAGRHDGAPPRDWLIDAVIVTEAAALGAVLTQIVKFSVGRERPHVHALREDDKPLVENPSESNLSFFSGHTSLAFSIATSAGTVASQRRYRWAPVVWAVGLPLAASAGYFRIGADKHWASDVLLGAVIGSAVGVGVPSLLHRRVEPGGGVELTVVPTGRGIALLGVF